MGPLGDNLVKRRQIHGITLETNDHGAVFSSSTLCKLLGGLCSESLEDIVEVNVSHISLGNKENQVLGPSMHRCRFTRRLRKWGPLDLRTGSHGNGDLDNRIGLLDSLEFRSGTRDRKGCSLDFFRELILTFAFQFGLGKMRQSESGKKKGE